MGILFDQERRLRCAIARERDIAASAADPRRRVAACDLSRRLSRQLPQGPVEPLLLTHG
ncbi:MAG: hypothetical protein J0I47_14145 [Sphingomonas sp.]|uniref:hypothetical protein n=1 Tax=Sphingomonas sp. TaxID=28214 RepID=UPI001AC9BFA0|nr:hypothetical protein [Sphingomonas sp.]MBN8809359.1 hypothetical protein [Sphingomonas sp.]